MRGIILVLSLVFIASCGVMQKVEVNSQEVTVTCGSCVWEMTSDGCFMAILLDGKRYIVDNEDVDAHGDAHAEDGMCRVERKAIVSGYTKGNVFYSSKFELIAQ